MKIFSFDRMFVQYDLNVINLVWKHNVHILNSII